MKKALKILAMPFIFILMLVASIIFGVILAMIRFFQTVSLVFTEWMPEASIAMFAKDMTIVVERHDMQNQKEEHNA